MMLCGHCICRLTLIETHCSILMRNTWLIGAVVHIHCIQWKLLVLLFFHWITAYKCSMMSVQTEICYKVKISNEYLHYHIYSHISRQFSSAQHGPLVGICDSAWEHVWWAAGPHTYCCCCGGCIAVKSAIVTWHHSNTHTVQGHNSAKGKLSRVH